MLQSVCVYMPGGRAAGPPCCPVFQSNSQTESPGQAGGALQQASAAALQHSTCQPTNLSSTNKQTNQRGRGGSPTFVENSNKSTRIINETFTKHLQN